MHARKTQRINDGYFEKHQAHPYQNSKYSNSKGTYSERYSERLRDSPNGNSYRSDSPPDSGSPRDRAYHSKLYMQKIRDKERDGRDYNTPRDKYSDCSRSPKRRETDRNNHERLGGEERSTRLGDWSEHISSSGKKYYYNCKSEVSQWEKPREWMERDRRYKEADPRYLARLGHDKHSTPRVATTGRDVSGSAVNARGDGPSKGSAWGREDHPERRRGDADDMDISPESTPRSDSERRIPTSVPNSLSAVTTGSVTAPPATSTVSTVTVSTCNATTAASHVNAKAEEMKPLTLEVPPTGQVDGGPPTPTHSENHDGTEQRKLESPAGTGSLMPAAASVSSSLLALRPTTTHLTPSLGNYYREELTNHIKNWPVHPIEKQILKLSEETHNLTSIHCTRVSAELKTSRAVVRLTEIQATLQEQRVLFLRQQTKTLEELNTQHSFMGD